MIDLANVGLGESRTLSVLGYRLSPLFSVAFPFPLRARSCSIPGTQEWALKANQEGRRWPEMRPEPSL